MIGFSSFPQLFQFDVVDKNYELIDDYICSSSWECILYFLNIGMVSGGDLGTSLISLKKNKAYIGQFFFNMFLFIFINLILSNIFIGIVTEAFNDMFTKEN